MYQLKFRERDQKWCIMSGANCVSNSASRAKVLAKAKTMGWKVNMAPGQKSAQSVQETITVPNEFSINERFDFLTHFVKMVAKKKINSLVISGPGGLGKTHTVVETLKSNGLTEDTIGEIDGDFIMIKGFTTAKALYRLLWVNNGKVIVFDDCDSAHKDPIAANLLKGALDSSDRRIISWNAEFSESEEMPNRFEFFGRVVFISNVSMDKIPQALISRSMRVSLDMTSDEKLERIAAIIDQANFMPNLERDVKRAALKMLKSLKDKCTDLNIRTVMQLATLRDGVDDDAVFAKMASYMVQS